MTRWPSGAAPPGPLLYGADVRLVNIYRGVLISAADEPQVRALCAQIASWSGRAVQGLAACPGHPVRSGACRAAPARLWRQSHAPGMGMPGVDGMTAQLAGEAVLRPGCIVPG
jgi:hypothetical protein